MVVLVGDIGGTNTRLAVFEGVDIRHKQTFCNAEVADFHACLTSFLEDVSIQPTAAVFGLAGPVDKGRIQMTNLNWTVDEAELTSRLGIPVKLLNDFHIQALGMTL